MRYLCHLVYRLMGILILIILLNGCQSEKAQKLVQSVRAEQVKISHVNTTYYYAGVVGTHEDIDLSFQVGGKIAHRFVQEGDNVEPGQLLASLDTQDLILQEQNLAADVKLEESTVANSKSDLNRYTPLVSKGYVSKSFYDQAKTKYLTDLDRLAQTKSELGLAQRKLAYANLYAESPGIITKTFATEGQVVSAGKPILRMARIDKKVIIIYVPEQRIEQFQNIGEVNFNLWAYPDKQYKATVSEIAGEADPMTRTYKVQLKILNPDSFIRLGMTANVQIQEKGSGESILTLPLTAISYETPEPSVWVINLKDMTVQPIVVTLGEFKNNQITINSGLSVGQWVVTDGVNNLRPGQKVKILNE